MDMFTNKCQVTGSSGVTLGNRPWSALYIGRTHLYKNTFRIGYIHISACTTRVVQTAAGGPITAVLSITE